MVIRIKRIQNMSVLKEYPKIKDLEGKWSIISYLYKSQVTCGLLTA